MSSDMSDNEIDAWNESEGRDDGMDDLDDQVFVEMTREELNKQRCEEPISLEPPALKAFADRQSKLVTHPKWPVQNWYNDEDFCRAYNTAVGCQDEVERLQQQIETEQKWAAFLRCCALSGEIPPSREEFDANQQKLRMIKENQSGTQSTKPGTSPEPEA